MQASTSGTKAAPSIVHNRGVKHDESKVELKEAKEGIEKHEKYVSTYGPKGLNSPAYLSLVESNQDTRPLPLLPNGAEVKTPDGRTLIAGSCERDGTLYTWLGKKPFFAMTAEERLEHQSSLPEEAKYW